MLEGRCFVDRKLGTSCCPPLLLEHGNGNNEEPVRRCSSTLKTARLCLTKSVFLTVLFIFGSLRSSPKETLTTALHDASVYDGR